MDRAQIDSGVVAAPDHAVTRIDGGQLLPFHEASPSRHDGTVTDTDRSVNTYVHATVTSTLQPPALTERNTIALQTKVPGKEISEVTPADHLIFAPYQPVHRQPYDLRNCFDRTNLAIVIRDRIERCESYVALARQMHSDGRMSTTDFAQRAGERLADLREHRNALFRLNELGRN